MCFPVVGCPGIPHPRSSPVNCCFPRWTSGTRRTPPTHSGILPPSIPRGELSLPFQFYLQIVQRSCYFSTVDYCLLPLMVSSSLYVSHMFVARVMSSLFQSFFSTISESGYPFTPVWVVLLPLD